MKPLVMPQVNLNGTSRAALVEQQCNVMHALDALQKALQEASPNGRDYQFRPAELKPALAAWQERMQIVHDMHKEIEAHALAIHDGK